MRATTIASLLLAANAFSQSPFERVEVVRVDSTTSANVLQSSARLWIANSFRDAQAVIQVDDPDAHRIVGKATHSINANSKLDFTMEITCKTGRCRIKVYDVVHRGVGSVGMGGSAMAVPSFGPMWDDERCHEVRITKPMQGVKGAEREMLERCAVWRPYIHERLNAIALDFKAALEKAVSEGKKDDW